MPDSKVTRRRFLAGAGAAAFTPALAGMAAAASPRANVVILFADDMGWGDLACYGHPNIRTPSLDRMAAEGIRFTSFYAAASVCTPSRAGLLTGRYPLRAGQPSNLGPDSQGGLPLSEITLAQLLKTRGYRTMAIGKWHLGHQPEAHLPTSRGFDHYYGLPYSNDMIPPWVKTERPLRLYRDLEEVDEPVDQPTLTPRYTEEAKRFIKSSGSDPFFLYLPYAMPHLPVSAPGDRRGRSRAGLYGDTIETLDWSVGEILNTLREQGIEQNTLVFFASDNGPWHNLPPRMLQNGVEPWHTGSKGLFRGAKGGSYEGGFRVPGIARWPGVIPPAQVTPEMASTLDLFPTVAGIAGAALPSDRTYDGFDLLPLMKGDRQSPRTTFFYCRDRVVDAVREGAWKCRLSRHERSDLERGAPLAPEVYNLEEDPGEMYNRYPRERERGDRLLGRMREFAEALSGKTAG